MDKLATVGSSQAVVKALQAELREMAGVGEDATINLGVDFAPGRRRDCRQGGAKRAKRIKAMKKRSAKIQALRKRMTRSKARL